MADQVQFATISGDRNPIHLDAVQARRSQAGAPVVHGIHLMLWALDELARSHAGGPPPMRRLTAHFNHFVAVDEPVAVVLATRAEATARFDLVLDLVAAGLTVARVMLDFGAPVGTAEGHASNVISVPVEPYTLAVEQMERLSGRLTFASTPHTVAAMFPAVSGWLGSRRVAALAASSLLVGMVCPGLHSIYRSLTVDSCDEQDTVDALSVRVGPVDPRFRVIRSAIVGGGLRGTVGSLLRTPPVQQPSSFELTGVVEPAEFAGSKALVVGGSRGLGEVTAKLLAAGGAEVVITYRVGKAEAEAVALDICAAGGICKALTYDVAKAADPQLCTLGDAPTHAYYFATPTIFRAQSALFDRPKLDAFLSTYVHGFLNLAEALRARRNGISLFYPSSIFVAERPRGMLEYAMAKAAGETLCSEINLTWPPMHVTVARLPRLQTDQTASIIGASLPSSVEILLPIIREVQSRARQGI